MSSYLLHSKHSMQTKTYGSFAQSPSLGPNCYVRPSEILSVKQWSWRFFTFPDVPKKHPQDLAGTSLLGRLLPGSLLEGTLLPGRDPLAWLGISLLSLSTSADGRWLADRDPVAVPGSASDFFYQRSMVWSRSDGEKNCVEIFPADYAWAGDSWNMKTKTLVVCQDFLGCPHTSYFYFGRNGNMSTQEPKTSHSCKPRKQRFKPYSNSVQANDKVTPKSSLSKPVFERRGEERRGEERRGEERRGEERRGEERRGEERRGEERRGEERRGEERRGEERRGEERRGEERRGEERRGEERRGEERRGEGCKSSQTQHFETQPLHLKSTKYNGVLSLSNITNQKEWAGLHSEFPCG